MNLLAYIYKQSWPLLVLATIFGVVSGLSGTALVGLISKGVSHADNIANLGKIFLGMCLLQLITKSFSEIILLRLGQNAIAQLRVNLSNKLLTTPLKKLQELGKPALLVILTKDIDTFINAFPLLPATFCNFIIIATCLGYMAWLSLQFFVIFTIYLIASIGIYLLVQRIPVQQLVIVRQHMDTLYEHFRSLIDGSRELKLNTERRHFFISEVVAETAHAFRLAYTKGMTGFTWVINTGSALFYIAIGMLLFVVPEWFPQKTEVLTTSTLILLYLIRPIGEMVAMMPGLHQANIALQKIQQLDGVLDAEHVEYVGADPFITNNPLCLELKGVCHKYYSGNDDTQFMLGPIDLTIKQGEIIFVVGGNGSGKTTLAMLLLGLYEPETGHLVLNGQPVSSENIEAYRQHFSAVFADFHLFEQVLMTKHNDLSERASHYVKVFGMDHKVKIMDGKFSTINLSTGQRKRLALVSSYLEDRSVYLFDEWAADQDPVFKRVFYTELLPELKAKGKTIIAITHDDSYFHYADHIVKLQDGHLHTITDQVHT